MNRGGPPSPPGLMVFKLALPSKHSSEPRELGVAKLGTAKTNQTLASHPSRVRPATTLVRSITAPPRASPSAQLGR